MSNVAQLKILARRPAQPPADGRRYDVPFEPGQSVLDGLRWIRVNRDPSLAIRFSCINANACKECMMELDGKTVYACTARLEAREMTLDAAAPTRRWCATSSPRSPRRPSGFRDDDALLISAAGTPRQLPTLGVTASRACALRTPSIANCCLTALERCCEPIGRRRG